MFEGALEAPFWAMCFFSVYRNNLARHLFEENYNDDGRHFHKFLLVLTVNPGLLFEGALEAPFWAMCFFSVYRNNLARHLFEENYNDDGHHFHKFLLVLTVNPGLLFEGALEAPFWAMCFFSVYRNNLARHLFEENYNDDGHHFHKFLLVLTVNPGLLFEGALEAPFWAMCFFSVLFINDISSSVQSNLRVFADRCVLYREVATLHDCQALREDLQNTLDDSVSQRSRI